MRLGGHIVEERERKQALSEQYASNLNPQHLLSRLCYHLALQEIQSWVINIQKLIQSETSGQASSGLDKK